MRYLSGLFLVLLFSSCEGYFNLKGKVLSSSSGKPVDDARFTLIVNEKDTVRLHCSIIERDSITPKERIQLRKKNPADQFTKRDQTSFYKYCDTLIHPDGSFDVASKLFNVTIRLPKTKLVVSSAKHYSEALALDKMHLKNIVVRLVER